MKKGINFIKYLFMGVALLVSFTIVTEARGDDGAAVAGFTHKIVYPDNQIKKEGYFDLSMTPGQKQTVQMILKNPGDEEVKVAIGLNQAMTNPNGVIEYGPSKLKADKSVQFPFADIVSAPKEVTIPGKAEVPLEIEIEMPKTSFDGILLGGIHMQQVTKKEERKKGEGTEVINEYAYVVGMQLSETDVVVKPDLKFIKAYGSQPDFRNTIGIDIGNTTTTIVKDLTMEAQIMAEKNDTVLFESRKSGMRMAPNTVINFPVSMQDQEMEPGKYRARVVATSGDQKWEWEESFTISRKEADDFNQKAIGLIQSPGMNWVLISLIVAGALAILLIIGVIIYMRNKKKKKKSKKRKKKGSNTKKNTGTKKNSGTARNTGTKKNTEIKKNSEKNIRNSRNKN